MFRSRRPVLSLLLVLSACGSGSDVPSPPTAAEIASGSADALVSRFSSVERALRQSSLDPENSRARADAGHGALVAYRRHGDLRLALLARSLLSVASADRAGGEPSCNASRDLAELERGLGDDAAARALVERALEDGVGSIRCRQELRALASALGVTVELSTTSTEGASVGRVIGVSPLVAQGQNAASAVSARVVVSLDRALPGELLPAVRVGGRRVARLRFEGVAETASISLPMRVESGGLLRIEAAPAGESGFDFVLEPTAVARAFVLEEPVRWVIDVLRDPSTDTSRRAGPLRLVVLDPGHGGDEHGARVDGTRESNLVLDIARRAAVAIAARLPSTRILLTRNSDDEVSLEQRSALANALDADLFVSIHLNDSDVPVQTGGLTTFVLDTQNDEQARRLAARENGTTTDRVSGLSVLLAGLERESQVAESRRLASFVHAATLGRARTVLPGLPDRGVRSAMFYVLVGTRMPSILLEASFMTRPEELTALRTGAYRQRLADGIAEGVARYAASR